MTSAPEDGRGRPEIDRAAAVRAAVRELVAERGFHGASMAAVAARAGVATGTAYVHYASKDELVLAAYREAKRDLGVAAVEVAATTDPPDARARFVALWLGAYEHLAAVPGTARFLLQVDASPYATAAHQHGSAPADDPLVAELERSGLRAAFLPLPDPVLYELGLAPAVRLAAAGIGLSIADRTLVAGACWAAVTGGG